MKYRYADGGPVSGEFNPDGPGIGGNLFNFQTPISPVVLSYPSTEDELRERFGLHRYEDIPPVVPYINNEDNDWTIELQRADKLRKEAAKAYENWANAYAQSPLDAATGRHNSSYWTALNKQYQETDRLINDYNLFRQDIKKRGQCRRVFSIHKEPCS